MGNESKLQQFPYSLRTIAHSGQTFCGYQAALYIVPPQNALTIENLNTHFVMQFDSAIAAANRKIESIGIIDEWTLLATQTPNRTRRITINQSADANRRVDLNIDLTHLLKNTDINYRETVLGASDPTTGYTFVEILLPAALGVTANVGTIELWKIDGLYTTTGIR